MRFCNLQQRPQPAHVVGRIHGGVRHTFSHGFVRGEVQDAGEWGVLRGMLLKYRRQGLTVAHVHLRKRHVGTTQGLHAFHSLKGGVVEVVQQNREESGLVKATAVWLPMYPAPPVTKTGRRGVSLMPRIYA